MFLERLKTVEPEHLVYVDESGLEENFQREFAYCLRGERLLGERSGKRFVSKRFLGAQYYSGVLPW